MKEQLSPAAGPIAANSPPSPAHRPLSAWRRLVCVPLGLLWLAILLILAIPVCLYMTLLYSVVRAFRWPARPGSKARPSRREGTKGGNL